MEDSPKRRESDSKDDLLGWDANGRAQVDNHLDLAIRFSLRSIASNQPTEPEVCRKGTLHGERRPNSHTGSLLTNQFVHLAARRHQPRRLDLLSARLQPTRAPAPPADFSIQLFRTGQPDPLPHPEGWKPLSDPPLHAAKEPPWRSKPPEPTQPQTDRDPKPARPAKKENRDRTPRHPALRPSKKGAPERNAPEPRTQLDRPAAARRRLDRTVGVGDRKQKRARTDAARTAGLSRTSDFLHCCIVAIALTNQTEEEGDRRFSRALSHRPWADNQQAAPCARRTSETRPTTAISNPLFLSTTGPGTQPRIQGTQGPEPDEYAKGERECCRPTGERRVSSLSSPMPRV